MPECIENPPIDYVTLNNDRADRVFDRLHQIHGEKMSEFLQSLGSEKEDESENAEAFLFHMPLAAAKKH